MQRLTNTKSQKYILNNIILGFKRNLSYTNDIYLNRYNIHNYYMNTINKNQRCFNVHTNNNANNNINNNNNRSTLKEKDKRRSGSFSMPNTASTNNNYSSSHAHIQSRKQSPSTSTSTTTFAANSQGSSSAASATSSFSQSTAKVDVLNGNSSQAVNKTDANNNNANNSNLSQTTIDVNDTNKKNNLANNNINNENKEKTFQKTRSITRTTKVTDKGTIVHEESQHSIHTEIQFRNQTLNIDFEQQEDIDKVTDHSDGGPPKSHQTSTKRSSRTVTMNNNDSGYIESITTQNEIQDTKDIEPSIGLGPSANGGEDNIDVIENEINSENLQKTAISLPIPNEIDDILTVGNPTPEEIERRRKIFKTPYAIMIHPSRSLPRVLTEQEKKKQQQTTETSFTDFTYRIRQRVREITKTISTKIIGQEKFEKLEEDLKTKHKTWRENWENTQHPYIIKVRSLVDKIQMQTEQSKAMELLQKEMGSLWIEDLLPEFKAFMIPKVVNAYLQDDLTYLSSICVGEAAVFVRNMIEARIKANIQISSQILFHDDVELIEMKVTNDKKAALIIRADVQSVDCVYERGTNNVVEGSPSSIANNVFILTIEPNFDKEHMKKACFPWQIRQIQTAKLRQLV